MEYKIFHLYLTLLNVNFFLFYLNLNLIKLINF